GEHPLGELQRHQRRGPLPGMFLGVREHPDPGAAPEPLTGSPWSRQLALCIGLVGLSPNPDRLALVALLPLVCPAVALVLICGVVTSAGRGPSS
ncbi:hypothetical protein, partial [Micromonospora luteifusca]|uniref:hypothetical protein n=1 Tax=Micromonospora luteifusca TaxID=709860 RepID=UPI0033B45464